MNHQDHVHLLRKGILAHGGVWADLGSGTGAFTLALADLLGPGGPIYSVDKNRSSLREQEQAMRAQFPATIVEYIAADFTRPLSLSNLDGIVMANSLHFVHDKDAVLDMIRGYLRPGGRLLLVEYNADRGNPWVPYPLSYSAWKALASRNGFASTQLLEKVPSRFLNEMYSAVSLL
ncbi:MAG TPA: methyltransferase domain-containing protein [Ktedonosporobacter sp.]|nr:methyltransferase domain-containing protein [Ktedonosporobacter sp.]